MFGKASLASHNSGSKKPAGGGLKNALPRRASGPFQAGAISTEAVIGKLHSHQMK
jgi:hypothetical protein